MGFSMAILAQWRRLAAVLAPVRPSPALGAINPPRPSPALGAINPPPLRSAASPSRAPVAASSRASGGSVEAHGAARGRGARGQGLGHPRLADARLNPRVRAGVIPVRKESQDPPAPASPPQPPARGGLGRSQLWGATGRAHPIRPHETEV